MVIYLSLCASLCVSFLLPFSSSFRLPVSIFLFFSLNLVSLPNLLFVSPQPVFNSAIISFFIFLTPCFSLPLSLPHSFLSLTPSLLSPFFLHLLVSLIQSLCLPTFPFFLSSSSSFSSSLPIPFPHFSLPPIFSISIYPSLSSHSFPLMSFSPSPSYLLCNPSCLSLSLPVISFIPPGISLSLYLLVLLVSFSVLYFLPTHVIFSLSLFICPISHPFCSRWRPGPCLPLQEVEGLLSENEMLQAKLHSQEEDFRLQNSTLMAEFSKVLVPGIAKGQFRGRGLLGLKMEGS